MRDEVKVVRKKQQAQKAKEKEQAKYEQTIKFDTLAEDLSSVGKTIEDSYNHWQSQDSMNAAYQQIQTMQKRLDAYQSYQKQNGGADLSEISEGYRKVMENWKELQERYSKYSDAESYQAAVQAEAERHEQLMGADVDALDKEIEALQGYLPKADEIAEKIHTYQQGSNYNQGRIGSDGGFDQKVAEANAEMEELLKDTGYKTRDELLRGIDEKRAFKLEAKRTQTVNTLPEEIRKETDFETYVNRGKEIADNAWRNGRQIVVQEANAPAVPKNLVKYAESGRKETMFPHLQTLEEYGDDDEKNTYYAYLGKGDKENAQKYLDVLEETLNARKGKEIADSVDKWYEYLGMVAKGGLSPFVNGTERLGNMFSGDEEYITPSATQIASSYISDRLDGIGKVAYDLGTTMMNMLPSIGASAAVGLVNPALGSAVGTTLMSASAAGNAYQEKINLGWSAEQARVYGIATGISEGAMQELLGGIGKLGGKLSGKSIEAITRGVDNAFARFALTWGGKMASEGLEESIQDIVAPFLENLARGYAENKISDIDLKDAAYSGMLGALSAGLLEGGSTVTEVAGENRKAKKIGKGIDPAKAEEVFAMAAMTPEESEAYKLYTAYANKEVSGENASAVQTGRLFLKTAQEAKRQGDAETMQRLASMLPPKKKSGETSKPGVTEIADEQEVPNKAEQKQNGYRVRNLKVGEKTTVDGSEDGTQLKLLGLTTNADGETETVLTDQGEVAVADMTFSRRDAELLAKAEVMPENANLFIKEYDGKTDVDEYADSFALVTAYAKHNYPQETMLANRGVLSERQVGNIYTETVKAEATARENRINQLAKEVGKTRIVKGTFDDSVIDYDSTNTDGSKVNWNSLTSRQRRAVNFSKMFAEATGVNIRFFQSTETDGKREGENGRYHPETNTVEIDVYAGISDAAHSFCEAIIPTLSHEVTHWMKKKSPVLYQKMREEVVTVLAKGKKSGAEGVIAAEMKRMQQAHPDQEVTPEKAMDELLARACEDMLGRSETVQELLAKMTAEEKKSLGEKVKELLEKLKAWVSNLMKEYASNSAEARVLKGYQKELNHISKVWDQALETAVKNNQVLQAEAERSGNQKNTAEQGDVKLSEREDFSAEIDEWEKDGIITIKIQKEKMRNFPPYNQSQSDANERATRWANREDVKEGTQKVVPYKNRWYVIEKTENNELKYQIQGRINYREYQSLRKGMKADERKNGVEYETLDKAGERNRSGNSVGGRRQDIDTVAIEHQREDGRIQQVAGNENGKRGVKSNATRGHVEDGKNRKVAGRIEDVQYSDREIVGDSGTKYGVGVYLDSNIFEGLNEQERMRAVKKFVVENLAGKQITAYDQRNRPVAIGIAEKGALIKNQQGKHRRVLRELYNKNIDQTIKQEAVVLADELIENATIDSLRRSAISHDWLDDNGKNYWEYWKVMIQEKNKTVWEATLNIANAANGEKILYDISPIKMVEGPIKSGHHTTTDSISDSAENVNTNFEKSAEKFSEREDTPEPDELYSDREVAYDAYEHFADVELLQEENRVMQKDIEELKQKLERQGKVTDGTEFNQRRVAEVAGHLRNISHSNYAKEDLITDLNGLYTYIAKSEDLAWNEVRSRSYDIARSLIQHQRETKITNDYPKMILRGIRQTPVSLSESQIAAAQEAFGNGWRNHFMGRVIISKDAIPLSERWAELAEYYPEAFDAETKAEEMPMALLEAYQSLRDASEVVVEYNAWEQMRELGDEIYRSFWDVPVEHTIADRYEKKIQRLNFEHRERMQNLRKTKNERMEYQKQGYRKRCQELIRQKKEQRERLETELADAKRNGRERIASYRGNVEKESLMKQITRDTRVLAKKFVTNSTRSHIPEVMREPVADLVNAIRFSSDQLNGVGRHAPSTIPSKRDIRLADAIEKIKKMVNDAQPDADGNLADSDLAVFVGMNLDEDLNTLLKAVTAVTANLKPGEYVLQKMNRQDLKSLSKMLTSVRCCVDKVNDFYTDRSTQGVVYESQATRAELKYMRKKLTKSGAITSLLKWKTATPYYAFKRLGESGQRMFGKLQDGWDGFAFRAKEIVDFTGKAYKSEEVRQWQKEVKEIKLQMPKKIGESKAKEVTVSMTVPQIMSLYCLGKREQARNHLLQGGIRIGEYQKGRKTIDDSSIVHLSWSGLQSAIGQLSERQKEVADALQKFMSEECSQWGNDITMERFGYKAFGEKNYFPIRVADKNGRIQFDDSPSLWRLANMSFTKPVNDKASNAVVIDNIFDVFAEHTADMAKYNTLAMPVLDMVRWMQHTEKVVYESNEDGVEPYDVESVANAIASVYGKAGKDYFFTFLQDINGTQRSQMRMNLGSKFVSKAKVAAVAANVRVALLQPTAYIKAGLLMDAKYLLRALVSFPKAKKGIETAEKYCGMAAWKALGYYDTDIQRGLASQIKHDESAKDKVVDFSMKGAEWGDKITWGILWNACEMEVKDKQKNLRLGSEEYYRAIGTRLREIIYATQVVDSTMTRCEAMRSNDMMDKLSTAFMSEPILAYNMLADEMWSWENDATKMGKAAATKKHASQFTRLLTVYTLTNTVAALVESAMDKIRDDDDETQFMEYFWDNWWADMSVLQKIPYAKELISLWQGYDSSRMDTAWMSLCVKFVQGVQKNFQGKGKAHYTAKQGLRAVSYLSGLPIYNAYRDSMAVLKAMHLFSAEELDEFWQRMMP